MSDLTHRQPPHSLSTDVSNLTFNLVASLPGRASSRHTQRAYFRWVDTYLADLADIPPAKGDKRIHKMSRLSVPMLQEVLSARQLRAWLGTLVQRGHGKQGIDQARAAIVTLADLVAEAEWMMDYEAAAISRVRPPRAEDGQRPGRWLSTEHLKLLMVSTKNIATSDNQRLRNHVLMTMLCTMALRREELSNAKWGDLSIQNNRVVLRIHGKGRKVAYLDVPKPVLRAIDSWRGAVTPLEAQPSTQSPLLRRIWKGGRISKNGLSADGVWLIVEESAQFAGIGHVAPHDLRRSVAGALYEAGTAVDKISRLLRHSNIAVTEKYLNRLPHANEGAVLMSDLLGLDDAPEDEWFKLD